VAVLPNSPNEFANFIAENIEKLTKVTMFQLAVSAGLAATPISALWMTGGPSHPHSSPGDENQRGVFDVQGLRR
jgi:hypothetical protein